MNRVIAFIMMIFFLIGIIGLRYDAHYCGGKLISSNFSFIPQNLSCGMKNMDHEIHDTDDKYSFHKICCEDDHRTFSIDDDFNDYQYKVSCYEFSGSFSIMTTAELQNVVLDNDYAFIGYSPPPVERDLVVFHQTFLI